MTKVEHKVVPIKDIVIEKDRGRKIFNRIDELSESIRAQGLINPIYVTEMPDAPGKYKLIAGERRFRASCLAGLKEVPISFAKDLDPVAQKVVELEENVCRQDLDWQEEAELHRQIDELKRKQNPNWRQQDTAELVQVSQGHVSLQIEVAKRLRESPELRAAVKNLPIRAAQKVIEQKDQIAKVDRLRAAGKLKLTIDFRCGDARDLIRQIPDKSIDLIICDPPYGLEQLEDIREGSGGKFSGHQMMSEHHNQSIEQVLQLLRDLAPQLHRVLKPGAHWYIFSAYQYVGEFIKALSPLVFQPPLLHWDREKPTTPGYGYNYLNTTEAIIYGYNPPVEARRRLIKNMYNIIKFPEVPSNLRVYPTEKPQGLLRELISQSSNPNDVVLDFCGGSGSTLKAAKFLGRRSIGFEINPDSWKTTLLNMQSAGEEIEETLFAPKE